MVSVNRVFFSTLCLSMIPHYVPKILLIFLVTFFNFVSVVGLKERLVLLMVTVSGSGVVWDVSFALGAFKTGKLHINGISNIAHFSLTCITALLSFCQSNGIYRDEYFV